MQFGQTNQFAVKEITDVVLKKEKGPFQRLDTLLASIQYQMKPAKDLQKKGD